MNKSNLLLFLKGMAMGAANVIPGVSGGTIAFITGIYERFINALKAFDATAIRLLFTMRLKDLSDHIQFKFLLLVGLGVITSLLAFGRVLNYLFLEFSVYVWSFFFGLIAISIFSVGQNIKRWTFPVVAWAITGACIAILLAFLRPAGEDDGFLYLFICGIVSIASMILPGLSGSFVLILMGNYHLIMLDAVPNLKMDILLPVGLGAVVGFILLSRLISYLIKRHHDPLISILTGFIFGSLFIIWPWKTEVFLLDDSGNTLIKNGGEIVAGYNWHLPAMEFETLAAIGFILLGIFLVLLIERLAKRTT